MARKSKPDAGGSDKTRKTKTTATPPAVSPRRPTKSATPRIRKASAPKKGAVERVQEPPAPLVVAEFNPTDEQISMRAYFISERRRRFDLPGDANSDWLEAKRQLLSETRA